MKRLTGRTDIGDSLLDEIAFINPDDAEGMYNLRDIGEYGSDELLLEIANRLAEYEDMEEQGLLLRLPCKVGDRVYGIHGGKTILPMVAKWIETNECGWTIAAQYAPMAPKFYRFADFGKTVFTSREEAEKALEEEVCKKNTKNT